MTIQEKIINVIRSNINKDIEITLETNLIKDLNIDSFDKIMIISGLEEEFSINIDVDDFSQYENVNQIVTSFKNEFGGDQ